MLDGPYAYGAFTNFFLIGWVALFLGQFFHSESQVRSGLLAFGGRVVPFVLLLAFCVGFALSRDEPGNITTFAGLLEANTSSGRVLAAWFEILGLALLVGRWIVDDSARRLVPRYMVSLCLVATFFAAAFGVLLYVVTKRFFDSRADQAVAGR